MTLSCFFALPLHAEPLKLLVWINGDKGYTGLQKVGDAFAHASGVPVTVEHPEDAPPKFAGIDPYNMWIDRNSDDNTIEAGQASGS